VIDENEKIFLPFEKIYGLIETTMKNNRNEIYKILLQAFSL